MNNIYIVSNIDNQNLELDRPITSAVPIENDIIIFVNTSIYENDENRFEKFLYITYQLLFILVIITIIFFLVYIIYNF